MDPEHLIRLGHRLEDLAGDLAVHDVRPPDDGEPGSAPWFAALRSEVLPGLRRDVRRRGEGLVEHARCAAGTDHDLSCWLPTYSAGDRP
ncbi:MAG: hypothetical protein CMH83_19800 [Nocardioides sp.]|nr:hypothetical protein [Nocardioides sp.]